MKVKILNFLFVMTFLGLINCESSVSGFNPDKHSPQIVLNSLFAQDSLWKVQLSKSKDILSNNNNYERITNAIVRITDSKGNTSEFKYEEKHGYILNQKPSTGEKYAIEVEVPGFEIVNAEDYLPARPKIISSTIEDSVDFEDNKFYSRVDISFKDEANEINYYELIFFEIDLKGQRRKICFKTNNIAIENQSSDDIDFGSLCFDDALFTDNLFNGKQFTLSIRMARGYPQKPIYVYLRSCSKSLYRYFLTYQKALANGESPYSEPVQVYSNIQNGVGIFGGYSADTDTLR